MLKKRLNVLTVSAIVAASFGTVGQGIAWASVSPSANAQYPLVGMNPVTGDSSQYQRYANNFVGLMDNSGSFQGGIASVHSLNSSLKVMQYINGSYNQQGTTEYRDFERNLPLAIQLFNAANLTAKIDNATDTSFTVDDVSHFRATQAPDSQTYSTSAALSDVIEWIRIDDEIMRIKSINTSTKTLTVLRGQWGTTAKWHSVNSPVYSPIYVGNGYRPGYPGNGQETNLRYAMNINDPAVHQWLFDNKLKPNFDNGYDWVWLDVTNSNWFNTADSKGNPVTPWYHDTSAGIDEVFTHDLMRTQQTNKINALYDKMAASYSGKGLTANGIRWAAWLPGTDGEEYKMFADAPRLKMMSMEAFVQATGGTDYAAYSDWQGAMNTLLDALNVRGDHVDVWAKPLKDYTNIPDQNTYEKFAFASYLLAYNPAAQLKNASAWFENLAGDGTVSDWYKYDVGTPDAGQTVTDIDSLKLSAAKPVYKRTFSKNGSASGIVLVNPHGSDDTTVYNVWVGSGWTNAVTGNVQAVDANGNVQLGPHDVLILVK